MSSVTLWQNRLFFLLGLTKGNKSCFPANIYSETIYRGLIHRETKRSERSEQPCRILLVYRTNAQGLVLPLKVEHADKTIPVLSSCCRSTDYVGWYRHGWILGVLLTTLQPDVVRNGCESLMARVGDSLRGILAFTDDESLQMRVLGLDELSALDAADRPAPVPGSKR